MEVITTIPPSVLPMQTISARSNAFGWHLFSSLTSNETALDNVVLCPFSIAAVLHLVYFAARGNTRRQLTSVLHLHGITDHKLETMIHKQNTNFGFCDNRGATDLAMKVVSSAFVDKHFVVNATYRMVLKRLNVPLVKANFVGDYNKVRIWINDGVQRITSDRINDLLPKDSINALTRLVLVNAIYFKGVWRNKFHKNETQKTEFTRLDGSQKVVDMMYQYGRFKTSSNSVLEASIIRLPFGKDCSPFEMIVVLPWQMDGLAKTESLLSRNPHLALQDGTTQKVKLFLPRFKIEQYVDLNNALENIGVTDMFDKSRANMQGMTAKEVFVSRAVHKSVFEVNEEGAEGSGSSAVVIEIRTSSTFRADHPFLFMVIEKRTQTIVFIGRVIDP